MDFTAFVLQELPPPPLHVLEIGCGEEGGVVPSLLAAGYEAVGVDPRAPEGEHFLRTDFRELRDGFDVAVAGRVLHHVHPLDDGLDAVVALAPRLIVDEFAWDRIGAEAQDWYEAQHRLLRAAGISPTGPPSLDEWRTRHIDLHPHAPLLEGLRTRYEETTFEWLPYLHRWLGGPGSEALEDALVGAGAFDAIGWRWSGVRR